MYMYTQLNKTIATPATKTITSPNADDHYSTHRRRLTTAAPPVSVVNPHRDP